MKRKFIIFLPLCLVFLTYALFSCRQEKSNVERTQARLLYERTCKEAALYIDSMRNAKDSTMVSALLDRFEERLVKINYDAVPDTDYALSEGENDTIKMALDSLLAMRVRRLKELGERKPEPTDSIDSIAVGEQMHLTSGTVKVKQE